MDLKASKKGYGSSQGQEKEGGYYNYIEPQNKLRKGETEHL